MSEAEKAVADFEVAMLGRRNDDFLTIFTPKLVALIADWRQRGEDRDLYRGWWQCARGIADEQDARMRAPNGSLKV